MSDENEEVISKHQFYFETSLYEAVYCTKLQDFFSGAVDAYNSLDGFDTTYNIECSVVNGYEPWSSFYRVHLKCKRGGKTNLLFFVAIVDEKHIMKVGQWPSLADIQFAEVGKRYEKHLSMNALRNYKKAIGLYAHGAGAGSFVYLRRIFEDLIFGCFQENKDKIAIKDDEFKKKRMEEKVDALKDYLPSQLLEMKNIYGILSKGVHELSEEECLSYFSPIKLSIELILDQKIEQKLKIDRDTIVKSELQKIQKNLAKGDVSVSQ
jgi:hypothetical protein